ncbi:MAG TPA: class I SAM-dependent methyltransferase [Gaiellaceae bacterium]|nr:class I SAM-dependent methyltransferase [Gaiellaceae bacterium]
MTLNPYDISVAKAFKESREIPLEGLAEWRDAVRRHLDPGPGMKLLDLGAGTGAFASAFSDWFGIEVVAVEPSAAMRSHIRQSEAIEVLEGSALDIPLPDVSADAAWLSLVIHHLPDLAAAAQEIRRVLRPGGPVLIRQGFPDRALDGIEIIRWFPETAKLVSTYPSLVETCAAFERAGFRREAVEPVRDVPPGTLADFLRETDTLRRADTTLRMLTEDEFERGRERLRRAVEAGNSEPRANVLDLLVFR